MSQQARAPRCALFFRVSTGEQVAGNQHADVYALVKARGYEINDVFEEVGSAAARSRPQFEKMIANAHRGRYDVIVLWSLDRASRSMKGMLDLVLDLDQRGVRVVSVREPWAEVDGPARALTVAVMGFCAQFERDRLIERTKAGMQRARAEGRRIGRPKAKIDIDQILDLHEVGKSVRDIARVVGVSSTTVHRALRTALDHAALRAAAAVPNGASPRHSNPSAHGGLANLVSTQEAA